jgi:hypothetical protein
MPALLIIAATDHASDDQAFIGSAWEDNCRD